MQRVKHILQAVVQGIKTNIPVKYRYELALDILKDNYSRIWVVSIVLFLIEFLLYIFEKACPGTEIIIQVFIISSLALIPLITYIKKHIRTVNIHVATAVQYAYALTVLLLGALLAVFAQSSHTDLIHMYIMAVFGTAAFAYMKPLPSAVLFGSVYILFVVLLPIYQSNPSSTAVMRINALISNIFGWMLSVMMVKAKISLFLNRKTIDEKNALLEELVQKDSMTGLYNHEVSLQKLGDEICLAARTGVPLSLIMLDIDDFKEINDHYGHLFGDEVIRKVACAIADTAQSSGIAGRYGGEEFIIILPGTPIGAAMVLSEKLRTALRAIEFSDTVVTMSGGVSEYHGETLGGFIRVTDEKLYRAKSNGKDQFETV